MLTLFYPASFLPHKNHNLLSHSLITECLELYNINIYLTISNLDITFSSSNVTLLGRISPEACTDFLQRSSALLFLSSFESLGLPLIEASQLMKPCICPDLVYARELLGNSPYYFVDQSVHSLASMLKSLALSTQPLRPSVLQSSTVSIETAWKCFTSLDS